MLGSGRLPFTPIPVSVSPKRKVSRMDYVYLGNSGLRVSRLCLGTMDFGDGMNE
ncbi:MAG: hypothetical protein IT538_00565, partial [Variibacter sp.]|nr:hypothetical protein [Variibacter sp.]